MRPIRGCVWSASACGYVASILLAMEQPLMSPHDIHLAEWRVLEKAYKARVAERRKHGG